LEKTPWLALGAEQSALLLLSAKYKNEVDAVNNVRYYSVSIFFSMMAGFSSVYFSDYFGFILISIGITFFIFIFVVPKLIKIVRDGYEDVESDVREND
jgi:Na+/proline symporter